MESKIMLFVLAASIVGLNSSNAQGPNWTNDAGVSSITDVYTANGRPGVTSAFFNNQIYVAYTSSNCSTGCFVKLAYSGAPNTPASQGALSFSTPAYISVPGMGNITSYNTPSLATQSGSLYLAWTDANNNNWLTSSLDGYSWQTAFQLAPNYSTTWAPSLAADPFNTGRIYVGYASSSTYTPIICAVYPNTNYLPSTTQNCANFSSLSQMNYGPGLFYWSGITSGVTMAYEWRGNQHCLSGYILNPETGYSYDWNPSQNCSDQTSVSPSLAQYNGHNGQLFLAFGGNNNNRQFNVRFATDGSDVLTNKQTLAQGMNGQPNLLSITPTNQYAELVNFYVWNNQLRYLFGSY